MKTGNLLISAAITGVLVALLSAVPVVSLVNCLVCGWLWMGGIFAVWFYSKLAGERLSGGQGLLLGLLSGLAGALVSTLISTVFNAGVASSLPADQLAQLTEMLGPDTVNALLSPATSIFITLILDLVMYSLFCTIGGYIGTLIFKPQPKPQQPPVVPPFIDEVK